MTALRKGDVYLSPEEYLAGERVSEKRHEYLAGVVHAMSGGTAAHARISGNILRELGNQLRGRRCEAFGSDMKVHIRLGEGEFFYYPDVSVDCSGLVDPHRIAIEEPVVVVEVLSATTERTDVGEKLSNYLRVPSLRAYILVGQYSPHATVHRRTGEAWSMEFFGDLNTTIELPEIECRLTMIDIYDRMGFRP